MIGAVKHRLSNTVECNMSELFSAQGCPNYTDLIYDKVTNLVQDMADKLFSRV